MNYCMYKAQRLPDCSGTPYAVTGYSGKRGLLLIVVLQLTAPDKKQCIDSLPPSVCLR